MSTQFLIFTLFGDYVLPRGGSIWTADLLYLMKLLGVSERASRSTLSRMVRKGWLASFKSGRHSRYQLTTRGRVLLQQGEQRIFEQPFTHWDGLWHLIIYSLPESDRKLRQTLRQQLIWFGFGRLAPGTWVSPHNRQAELETVFQELMVTDYVDMFASKYLGGSSAQELVQRCWNLPQLEAEYRAFVARYQPEYEDCAQSLAQFKESPESCFVRRFWLTHNFQPFPRKDPNLPTVLLPANWIGFTARQLFDDYRRLLKTYSNQFVDAMVINGDGPG